MKSIAIFGAGGFGREVKTIIDKINRVTPNTYNFLGYYDDGFEKGKIINGFPVLGGVKELNDNTEELSLVISLGDPKVKSVLINKIKKTKINYPNIIDPDSSISNDDVQLGQGCVICCGTILTCNIKIGNFVILNLMCTVGHDTVINDYCAFMPSVNVSGEVKIGQGVYVGTGAKIINLLEIGKKAVVGAGAVILKDIPDYAVVVGNPGKIIKYNK